MVTVAEIDTEITSESPAAFVNLELSWLQFARRVLELVQDSEVPLLERVKFAGILGMLHDEFFMKRIAGLKRQVCNKVDQLSLDGKTPSKVLAACAVCDPAFRGCPTTTQRGTCSPTASTYAVILPSPSSPARPKMCLPNWLAKSRPPLASGQTFGGMAVEGRDSIRMAKRHVGPKLTTVH